MSNWITHCIVSDIILKNIPWLDEKGFCLGNVAPDCNIENADWTAFEPPREFTHFMSGKSKLTTDYEKFFEMYVKCVGHISDEHYSFLLGYYSHLITDFEHQKFLRDEKRVDNMLTRISEDFEFSAIFSDYPKTYDGAKKAFGKLRTDDIVYFEHSYLKINPDSSYNRILRLTDSFPDYLDFLPKGAIPRKIRVMAYKAPDEFERPKLVFITPDEYRCFIEKTTEIITQKIKNIGQ